MSLADTLRKAVALLRPAGALDEARLDEAVRAVHGENLEALEHYRRWLPVERRQGRFFASTLVEHLPPSLAKVIRHQQWSLLDVGCSCGHLVKRLQDEFPRSRVEGVDIERIRIEVARRYYPECVFRLGDVTQMNLAGAFDVVFSSNVLEHFADPIDTLERLVSPLARRFVVSLVPWEERPLSEGHLYTFTDASFPGRLGAGLALESREIIDCRASGPECWPGLQALVVYRRDGA